MLGVKAAQQVDDFPVLGAQLNPLGPRQLCRNRLAPVLQVSQVAVLVQGRHVIGRLAFHAQNQLSVRG